MRCLLLLLLIVPTILCCEECDVNTAERYAKSIFNDVDAGFSMLIFIHNKDDPRFNATFDTVMSRLTPDFIYNINGHVITGREPIYQAVLNMLDLYTIRETHPPQPSIYPYGSYTSNRGIKTAHLTGKVFHTFVNTTGTYMDFNTHIFHTKKIHNGPWLMVNATLTRYAVIKT